MAYEELRERGLVEETRPDFRQISQLLARALQDLSTARANVSIDKEWAYTIAYQAMLRAGKAIVMAEGWRPRGRDQARTIVLLVGEILGEEARSLINGFDRMRRKRQDFMEERETGELMTQKGGENKHGSEEEGGEEGEEEVTSVKVARP